MAAKARKDQQNYFDSDSSSDSDMEKDAVIIDEEEIAQARNQTSPKSFSNSDSRDNEKPKTNSFPKEFPFHKFGKFGKIFPASATSGSPLYVTQIAQAGNIHIGNNFTNCTFDTTTKIQRPASTKSKTTPKVIVPNKITSSKNEVTLEVIEMVAKDIGEKWKLLASCLKFSQGQIDAIEIDNRGYGMEETVISMLNKWTEEYDTDIGKLAVALCSVKAEYIALKMAQFL